MTVTHTPTPWKVDDGTKSRGRIYSVCKGWPSHLVAQASPMPTSEEREANARLIAKAVNTWVALEELQPDRVRRLREVARTLHQAKGQAFAIDFKQLARDIEHVLAALPS